MARATPLDGKYGAFVRRVFFFLVAGGTGFLLYLLISSALHYVLGVREVYAAVFGALIPVVPTYFMQRNLTFKSSGSVRRSFTRYACLQAINAVLIMALSWVGTIVGLGAMVNFIISGVVSVVVSYVVQDVLVFSS